MPATYPIGPTVAPPEPPPGWFDYDRRVLMDGSIALLRLDSDFHAEHRHWWQAVQAGDTSTPAPRIPGRRARIVTFDGKVESAPIEIALQGFPLVDRRSDGRWLVVDARSETGASNGRILAADGSLLADFVAGDGIEHLACVPDGTFWIGYFDEGIFGGPLADGTWPVSSAGLARFSPDGEMLWDFNRDQADHHRIDDCYAFCLEGHFAWTCPYMDFPLIRIADGRVAAWKNEAICGARAMAAAGNHLLLAGGYGEDRDRLALVRLEGDEALLVGAVTLPALELPGVRAWQGRDGILHLIDRKAWTRISIDQARAYFGA